MQGRPKLAYAIGTLALVAALRPGGVQAAVNQAPFASVSAERVTAQSALVDPDVYQFLRADAKGRLFLLHADTLAVDQVQPSGKLVRAGAPATKREMDEGDAVIDAALSPDGDSWLLLFHKSSRLVVLKGGQLRDLPPPVWMMSALAFTVDGPVVAVLPAQDSSGENAAAQPTRADLEKPPLLLRLNDQKWQMLVPGKVFQRRESRSMVPQEVQAERASRLGSDPKGSLWVAQQDAYTLKKFSRSGALETSLLVGGGSVKWRDRTEEDWKNLEASAKSSGMKLNRSHLAKIEASRVVRVLTVHDSRVYLVVETPEGLALDQWDPVTQALSRVQLANITTGPSRLSLAAARDGLYLAAAHQGEPVWRLDWQRLEEAKWKPVPEAVVEGPSSAAKGR